MPLMTWNDNIFSVNIKLLDGHHKRLFDLLNTLHDAMKQMKARDVLGNVFSELIDYTVYHFKAEEELFQKHGYTMHEYAQHKKEHEDLTKTALDLKHKFDTDAMKTVLTMETMEFLKNWLNNHICGNDNKVRTVSE